MKIKSFLLFIFIISVSGIIAQTTQVTGKVTSQRSLDILPGTDIKILGTNIKTQTDKNGNYTLNGVTPGKKQIEFSNIAYAKKIILVDVSPSQLVVIDVAMEDKASELTEVKVSSTSRKNKPATISSIISEQRTTRAVISGISKQQIAFSQDNNAAQVMQRVPGVTITENRFVMIRGLNERYNSVMINDVMAPSTEIDKRTFSFDLIPSSALDRMLVFKSASPENPGDFAGGVIKLYTNNSVDNPFTDISIGMGLRQNTTFQNYYQSKGSSTDFAGFDNNYRSLPANFPTTNRLQNESRTSHYRESVAKMLPNNWDVNSSMALPDLKIGINLGRKFKLFGKKVSNVSSIDISQSFQSYQRDFYRYFELDRVRPNIVDQRFKYLDDVHEKQNRIAVMSNFTLELNSRNTIKFSNLFNQLGENETNLRQGEDFIQTLGWRRHYMLGYRSRSIYSGQLEGIHNIGSDKFKWVIGGSFLNENEPDLRRFRTYAQGGASTPKDNYTLITPPSSNLFDASRYYGNLLEFSINNGMDYTKSLGGFGKLKRELKFGYYIDYRYRDFASRYMSFLIPGSIGSARKNELENQPLSRIFSMPNISAKDGYILEEGTRPQDSYDASNFLTAGYISTTLPFEKFVISGGVRVEHNTQNLNSFTGLNPVSVNNPVLSVLPSVNMIYELSETKQVRLGYGRTLNRPEFRELAPFLFYDYKLDAGRVGNPKLTTASIDNIDIRFESYPRVGELISIGAFAKYFDNPIENINIITTEQPQFTYANADYAFNYGAELELRKSLDQYFKKGFFSKMTLNLNATYIFSEVNLGKTASAQNRVRPLQGQSPYIVNFVATYNDTKRKNLLSLSYNVFGSRIFAVGDLNNPDIHELPRHSLDLTYSKTFDRLVIKAGIQDILNSRFRFYQDTDRNASPFNNIDRPVFTFARGTLLNLTFTYKLNRLN
jgi:outer membrane receptor for ferrienterochelin and colicin